MERLERFIDREAQFIDKVAESREAIVELYEKAIEHRLSRVEIIRLCRMIKDEGFYLDNNFLKEKGVEDIELTGCKLGGFIHIYANKALRIELPQTEQELRKLFLQYRFDLDVYYEEKEIDVLFVKKRKADIWEDKKQKEQFEMYSTITLQKAETKDFHDLLHFVAYHSVHKICNKSKEEMCRFRMMQYKKQLGDEADPLWRPIQSELLGYYEKDKVYLCPELIEKTADDLAKKYFGSLLGNEQIDLTEPNKAMQQLLYKKVFIHEFGHLVFDWAQAKDREVREKQANYFSSYITDGALDEFISDFTRKQPKEYHVPYLKGDKRAQNLYKGTL